MCVYTYVYIHIRIFFFFSHASLQIIVKRWVEAKPSDARVRVRSKSNILLNDHFHDETMDQFRFSDKDTNDFSVYM